MSKRLTVFVDSDAFIAMIKEDDMSHERAKHLFLQLQNKVVTFLTSNYVFSETITVLSQRVGHSVAISYIENMTAPESQFLIERADETIEMMAIQLFKEQRSKNTSYVDCTNMAFVKHLNLDGIFSFDGVYRKNGLALAEDLITS
jgi:predicted nucleic acid-binding protein